MRRRACRRAPASRAWRPVLAGLLIGLLCGCAARSTGDLASQVLAEPPGSAAEIEGKSCCDAAPPGASRAGAALPEELAGLRIPDVRVIDERGRERRFRRDLIEGRTVVIGFFFTTCTTICPPLTATMAQIQDQLRGKGRSDIELISISIDPVTDTPERLRAWAASFGADPGWTFVTGDKNDIDELLKALDAFTPRPEDHAPILLAGNAGSGVWRREYALAPAGDLCEVIERIAGAR
ncbi:MAG: SCO family protein [Planctomycetota bacterium]